MIYKSPTRRNMSRNSNLSNPQTPRIRNATSFSNLRRKSSITPLATPRSVSSSRHSSRSGSRHSSPSRSSRSSSPTRLGSFSNYRRTSGDTFVHPDNVLRSRAFLPYRGTISVSIRIKPSDTSGKDPWSVGDKNTIVHNELGGFKFDNVFDPSNDNFQVYEEIGKPMIEKLFEGYNATIFAYGMTGSGKTFTMSGDTQEPGLILLSVEQIFAHILSESVNNKSFEVKVSYLEIYNEKIYDLLNIQAPRSGPWSGSGSGSGAFNYRLGHGGASGASATGIELKVRDDSKHGVKVIGLTEQAASTSHEVMKWIALGNSNRKTGETDYNTRSSRSHAIVLMRLSCTDLNTGLETTSTLSLCDLAGSERAAGQQERRKEGAFINKSLLALGTVISKLSANSAHGSSLSPLSSSASSASSAPSFSSTSSTSTSSAAIPAAGGHIPYRDSKLTRILQPALSGDSIVTTICTIDTKTESIAETVNTIRFASRAKNVSMTVKKNDAAATASSMQEKAHVIEELRRQLEEQQALILALQRDGRGRGRGRDHGQDQGQDQDQDLLVDSDGSGAVPHLKSENALLRFKLQHCEKLLDLDHAPVHDPEILEILDILPTAVGAVLEAKIQRYESQLREHQTYAHQLEQRLASLEARATSHSIAARLEAGASIDNLARDQEAELLELRRALTRKDKMLDALQSAKRLREHALRPLRTVQLNTLAGSDNKAAAYKISGAAGAAGAAATAT